MGCKFVACGTCTLVVCVSVCVCVCARYRCSMWPCTVRGLVLHMALCVSMCVYLCVCVMCLVHVSAVMQHGWLDVHKS